MMIKIVKKTILLCFVFVLSSNVFALNLEEEIAYYRDIKKPLEEFLEDLQDFVGLDNSGIFFRTITDKCDYSKTNYFATHYSEIYDFYTESLWFLLYGDVHNPFSIENSETLGVRQKIIDAIELIFYELEEICKAYLEPDKIDKIIKMSQPKIGYKGTLKLFQRISSFVKKHEDIINRIYIHERNILIFAESIKEEKAIKEQESKVVPSLNLPILHYENIKQSCTLALNRLDAVILFYIEKYNILLNTIEDEKDSIKKDKKNSIFDRLLHKKKEAEPIESPIIVEESSVINSDNVLPIKRRSSSLLKSLSPRSRTQSLKKISIDHIDKKADSDIQLQSTEINTSEEIKPIKKRSSSILKVLSPRALTPRIPTPRSPHGDGLNRGSSDSKLSPKKIVPEFTPRPKSGDDIIMCKRSNSLPHNNSDIISRAEIISKLEQLNLSSDNQTKKSKKDSKKKEKKDKKDKKKDKKRQKSSVKPVDKIQLSGLYGNPFDE